jgi:hypothetical protein
MRIVGVALVLGGKGPGWVVGWGLFAVVYSLQSFLVAVSAVLTFLRFPRVMRKDRVGQPHA